MLFAADYVNKLEIPVVVDRQLGDIHAAGNPHIQLDPRNYLPVARELTSRLTRLDSKNEVRRTQGDQGISHSLRRRMNVGDRSP